jgi:hypothetical protein
MTDKWLIVRVSENGERRVIGTNPILSLAERAVRTLQGLHTTDRNEYSVEINPKFSLSPR